MELPPGLDPPIVAVAQLESPIMETARFFAKVRAAGGTTILNPSPYRAVPEAVLRDTSIIIVNEHEFAALTGGPASEEVQQIIATLSFAELPFTRCIVTLGALGVIGAEEGQEPIHIPGHKVEPIDTTGAGDCFTGWFAAELAAGRPFQDAARRANAAAAISVTRAGAGPSMPLGSELEDFLRRQARSSEG